jgi:hypothetical protein
MVVEGPPEASRVSDYEIICKDPVGLSSAPRNIVGNSKPYDVMGTMSRGEGTGMAIKATECKDPFSKILFRATTKTS